MALNYVVTKRVFGFDKEKKTKYVARPVLADNVSFEEVRRKVCQISGMHRGTVTVILDSLIDVMINDVSHGHRIQLGEFGSIRPSMRSKCADTEEAVNANNVYRTHLIFTPGSGLKEMLNKMNVRKFVSPDTDYTVHPDDDGDEAVDPLA